jgi:hypothetical protein
VIRASSSALQFSSEALIEELADVLSRPGCPKQLGVIGNSAAEILADYVNAVELVEPASASSTQRRRRDELQRSDRPALIDRARSF